MLADINEIIASVLKERSMDRRSCYTSVRLLPPSASKLLFECSDEAVLDEVVRAIRERLAPAAGSMRYVLLPEPGAELPELLIGSSSVSDVRREPSHASELVTQIICGDPVTPLKEKDDWHLVRLDDGYIGWIPSWHLKSTTQAAVRDFRSRSVHRVAGNTIGIYASPSEDALPVCDAVIGTPVVAGDAGKRGWREVRLPDGKTGFARARAIERMPKRSGVSRSGLATTGLKFLGIPYLWGGTTPKGFDCSGLIQRIYRLHGVLIPRDADLQARFGRRKRTRRLESLRTGDLLFFGKSEDQITHVAMFLSNNLILHAHGQIRVGSLSPDHPLFEGKLARDWQITRDPLAQ